MIEYSRHYTFLKQEHYRWRDFIIHLKTDKNLNQAQKTMDKIMIQIFGWGILAFNKGKTESKIITDNIEGVTDRWLVRNTLKGGYLKYPTTQTWGDYTQGKLTPVDWELNIY